MFAITLKVDNNCVVSTCATKSVGVSDPYCSDYLPFLNFEHCFGRRDRALTFVVVALGAHHASVLIIAMLDLVTAAAV